MSKFLVIIALKLVIIALSQLPLARTTVALNLVRQESERSSDKNRSGVSTKSTATKARTLC